MENEEVKYKNAKNKSEKYNVKVEKIVGWKDKKEFF